MRASILGFVALLTLFPATSSGDAVLSRKVIGASGGAQTAGSVRARYTLGQALTGRMASGSVNARFGYWGRPSVTTSVPHPEPTTFGLSIARLSPNPVVDRLHVAYTVAASNDAAVSVRLYDARGALVRELADGAAASGTHAIAWDGRDAAGRRVRPGIYFCELRSGSRAVTRRVAVLH
jgi:hypothetical protein